MKINIINKNLLLFPERVSINILDSLEDFLTLYNPILGPVRSITAQFCSPMGFPVYSMVSHHYDLYYTQHVKIGHDFIPAAGKGRNLFNAFFGCLGESVERVIPVVYSEYLRRKVIYGTPSEMRKKGYNILGPDRLPLFAKEQYGSRFLYESFTEDSWIGWIKGENLLNGEEIFAPAQVVLFGYRMKRNEALIGYPHSAGLTAHSDLLEGRYHGICEIIERDSLNVRWVSKLPPKEISLENIKDKYKNLLDEYFLLKNPYIRTKIYYWTLDIPEIHVITLHCVNTSLKKLKYFPGMGADISFKGALMKALAEVGQAEKMCYSVTGMSQEGELPPWMDVSPDADYSKITDLFKTIAYYGFEQNLKKVEEFYSRSEKINLSDIHIIDNIENKYDVILEILKNKNYTPLCFDLTPPQFPKYTIQKLFIPELTQYFMVHGFYGHPRYYKLGKELGILNNDLTFNDLNKAPLPFP